MEHDVFEVCKILERIYHSSISREDKVEFLLDIREEVNVRIELLENFDVKENVVPLRAASLKSKM